MGRRRRNRQAARSGTFQATNNPILTARPIYVNDSTEFAVHFLPHPRTEPVLYLRQLIGELTISQRYELFSQALTTIAWEERKLDEPIDFDETAYGGDQDVLNILACLHRHSTQTILDLMTEFCKFPDSGLPVCPVPNGIIPQILDLPQEWRWGTQPDFSQIIRLFDPVGMRFNCWQISQESSRHYRQKLGRAIRSMRARYGKDVWILMITEHSLLFVGCLEHVMQLIGRLVAWEAARIVRQNAVKHHYGAIVDGQTKATRVLLNRFDVFIQNDFDFVF